MTPKLKAILDGIGYSTSCRYNRSLFFLGWEPNERGEKLFIDKTDARESSEALMNLVAALNDLPDHVTECIERQSKRPEDWDNSRDPLRDVLVAILTVSHWAEEEKMQHWTGPGASRRLGAEDIAKKLAEIYVLGKASMPTNGADADGNPSGVFPNTVQAVFDHLGMKHCNFRRPCAKAIKALKKDDSAEFKRLLKMRRLKDPRMSLFTGKIQI